MSRIGHAARRGRATAAGAGGGGPMNVLALPGISSWYDPSDPTAVYTASGSTYLSINNKQGDSVRNLVQLGVGLAPAIATGALNGRDAAFFDGVNDWTGHDNPVLYAAGRSTVAAIFQGAPQNDRHIINEADWAGQGIYTVVRSQVVNVNGAPDAFIRRISGSGVQYPGYTDGTVPAWVSGQTHLVITTDTGSVITHYVDGNLSSSHSYSRAGGDVVTSRFTLGCLRGNGVAVAFYAGYVGEIVCCTSVLGATDRQRLEGYMAHRWGANAFLPVGHPFKDAPPS